MTLDDKASLSSATRILGIKILHRLRLRAQAADAAHARTRVLQRKHAQ